MIRHISVALTSIVFLVLIMLNSQFVSARSATTSQYQQMNGLNEHSSTPSAADSNNAPAASQSPGLWKDLSMVYKIYQQCTAENLSVCLKVKLLAGLERVFRAKKNLKLIEGVQFVSSSSSSISSSSNAEAPLPSETDIEASLPRAANAKEYVLNNMIFKKISNYLQEHTLQIKFPDMRNVDAAFDSYDVEGRGKKKDKKGGGAYIMIPLLLGGTFVPIAYGALAMLAGKALIVSKLALVLASIIGIKKLLSGGGGGKESSHEVVVSGGNSGWGRDMDLAYSAWKPGNKELQTTAST